MWPCFFIQIVYSCNSRGFRIGRRSGWKYKVRLTRGVGGCHLNCFGREDSWEISGHFYLWESFKVERELSFFSGPCSGLLGAGLLMLMGSRVKSTTAYEVQREGNVGGYFGALMEIGMVTLLLHVWLDRCIRARHREVKSSELSINSWRPPRALLVLFSVYQCLGMLMLTLISRKFMGVLPTPV